MAGERGRFPVVLTLVSAVALAILIGLGVWQVKRLAWKTDMLARIEALQDAPAKPLETLVPAIRAGQDLEFARVSVDCPGIATAEYGSIYSVIDGQMGSRLVSACRGAFGGFDGVLVDRGFLADTISARPATGPGTEPVRVVGILRKGDRKPARKGPPMAAAGDGNVPASASVWYGRDLPQLARALRVKDPVPYFLMAETATNPEFKALKPAPIQTDIPNNHLSYAITWFGLAAALVGVYAALAWRKMQGR